MCKKLTCFKFTCIYIHIYICINHMKFIPCYLHASGRHQFTSLAKDCRQLWEPCMKELSLITKKLCQGHCHIQGNEDTHLQSEECRCPLNQPESSTSYLSTLPRLGSEGPAVALLLLWQLSPFSSFRIFP